MLHFLSPSQESRKRESGKNIPPAPRHRFVQALPQDARQWPFRVLVTDASVDLAEVAIPPGSEPGSDYAFVS